MKYLAWIYGIGVGVCFCMLTSNSNFHGGPADTIAVGKMLGFGALLWPLLVCLWLVKSVLTGDWSVSL